MATATTPPSSADGALAAAKAAAEAMPLAVHAPVTVRIEPPRGLLAGQRFEPPPSQHGRVSASLPLPAVSDGEEVEVEVEDA